MNDADLRNIQFTEWLQQNKIITKTEIFNAFIAIPRHKFLPNVELDKVYHNSSVVTKRIGRKSVSSATKPGVIAVMLEQLQLKRGQKVLEIGTGTGYNAALISHIVGPSGSVVSLDIDPTVIQLAKENLGFFNFDNLLVSCQDGWFGYKADAPFDRVIFTVGINDIPVFWQEQLKEDGVLIAPLWLKNGIQRTVAFKKDKDTLVSNSIRKCDFMRLRGIMAQSEAYTFLDDSSSLLTGVENEQDKEYLSHLFSLISFEYIERKLDKEFVLTGTELEEFIFYACLRGANCLLLSDYEGKDDFFSHQTLGIYTANKESLFVIRYNRQSCELSRQYNSDEAMREYFSLFNEWVSKDKPGDSKMRVIVLSKDNAIPILNDKGFDFFSFEKKSCYIIYKIDVS